MFTVLALGMTLSGAVAIETPIKAAADRPALVQVAANGMMVGGKRLQKKPIIAEKLGKPILAEKLRKPIIDERFGRRIVDEKR